MKNFIIISFVLAFIVSCEGPQPRYPVQKKSGSFFKVSIERSKKLLEAETKLIKNLMRADSLNTYLASPNGFWYTYESKIDTASYLPRTNDVVLLNYTIMTLGGDTLYRPEEIGLVDHAVDKSKLFPGLRNAVKLLKQGEKATFLFPSGQAFGYKGDQDKIGINLPIKTSLTLLEIKKDSSNLN